ncbi:bifunctional phosphoribosyl-AMP cyclohydrolase/phosphoribosyl-ATP diphosphatase HisIE [Marinihelvus fidelis]|uniref:Histidine biosynthesis bifunctional protein HisIE n=1 Tax=Marinihelvus fidelis TaxID=2613842 RepID=A0A5N0T9I0_9GAMM|nr:bifunctional phosphoribosyl-AMP cyclohydrolase/phosphoribosyl-ATP diphosphatase HisIE [Marinihelvus fidelis]KAA9131388.1 bifunctional phosphoribosyl-AMP cyclohydrolase/phosphoribosyl-ATP diphosphatase HisIE [Marinihelvus fidelis]
MFDANDIDWDKGDGLVPAVVQHAFDGRVLMLGYMNRESLAVTLDSGRVSFWSRSRGKPWTKGETSGNVLELVDISVDCDADTLLVRARPKGPTCHLGDDSCFDGRALAGAATTGPGLGFLAALDRLVEARERERPEGSYTTRLFEAGTKRVAQKVGEEGVETALAAAAGDRDELLDESADLLYHLLVLLRCRDASLQDVVTRLAARHG